MVRLDPYRALDHERAVDREGQVDEAAGRAQNGHEDQALPTGPPAIPDTQPTNHPNPPSHQKASRAARSTDWDTLSSRVRSRV